jgi:phenylalanyl-tRNA synthetase beta chain
MLISLNWLSDYVKIPVDPEALAERLTLAGLEVDRINRQTVDFDGIIVAEVTALRPLPSSDRNQVATINTGTSTVEVVTGAPNVAVGNRVPYAAPGARLGKHEIGSKTFRGVKSDGMLCSPVELGLGEDAGGILILDRAAALGQDLKTLYPADTILEIEIKSNRPDLLSHIGVAREMAAIFKLPLQLPPVQPPRNLPEGRMVTIEAPEGCFRFVGRLISEVRVAASPAWMQARLRAAGVRPISNVVDITNYVMMEMGQPMHAFDFKRLQEGRLVVRRAQPGESLLCLDGKVRDLRPEYMVVADARRPQALAGIIGGAQTAVEAGTTEVLLEAATWEPRRVRRTSHELALRTEASIRFEKGLSPALSLAAVDRAAALIGELAGGKQRSGDDAYPRPLKPAPIDITSARLERILGVRVPLDEAADILQRLEFRVDRWGDRLRATPPDFRLDCSLPEDLAEEIGRIYGYDRIPSTLPGERTAVRDLFDPADLEDRAKAILVGQGLDEAITSALVSSQTTPRIGLFSQADLLRIKNPMVENREALRLSLLPGLLEALAFNVRQDQPEARLFELGSVYRCLEGGHADEPRLLAIAVHLPTANADISLQELRSVQASLALVRARVGRVPTEFRQAEAAGLHPGRTAEIVEDGDTVGVVGEVHPEILAKLDLSGRAVAAEVLFGRFLGRGNRVPQATEVPRFPGIRLDLTVVVRNRVAASELVQVIRDLGGYTLREIHMLKEYQGAQLAPGARSLSFRLHYQADDRTLTREEVLSVHDRIIQGLKGRFGVEVRA